MPELPEVETIRRDLDRELGGKRIERVTAGGVRSIRRHRDAAEFAAALVGRTVKSVGRRGKYLRIPLGGSHREDEPDPEATLVIHLGMSGQLLLAAAGDATARHTHVVLGFDGGRELRFVDPRTFGEVFVTDDQTRDLARLGADPLEDLRNWTELAELLHGRTTKLKPWLMDQRFLAGIGNLYSDEILFAARLRYDRPAETLSPAEVRRLFRSMTEILQAAIASRGSSLADEQYRDVFGAIGQYQRQHRVYGREGEACPRCRRAIVRVKTGGRSTFLCVRCQR